MVTRRNFLRNAVIAGLGASALGRAGFSGAASGKPFKVGLLIPLSGPAGLFGPSSRNCAELAVAEINGRGGILGRPVELTVADAGVAPAQAAQTAVRLMLQDRVDALVGMHDSAVRSAINNAIKGRLPYVYTPVFEGGECAPNVFYTGETPPQQLEPVIPWLAREKGIKSWYLIGNDYNWPRLTNKVAKEYIAKAGGTVVSEEYVPFGVDNFDDNVSKIKAAKPDAVLITLVGGASVTFNRTFAGFGLASSSLRLGTLIEENTLLGIGADNSANLYSAMGYFRNLHTEGNERFTARYSQRFGEKAPVLNSLGESCFEGLTFLEKAANKAGGLDRGKLDQAAQGLSYEGPRGKVTMENRYLTQDIHLAEAQGVDFEIVKSFAHVSGQSKCS